jgi:hypothetical protein
MPPTEADTRVYWSLPKLVPEMLPADRGLAGVVNTWNRRPEAVRVGIVALTKAASGSGR